MSAGAASTRIRGLLLVLVAAASAAAAAAAASTTTALAFFRLVTFRTGKINSYRLFNVYAGRTWLLILPSAVFIVAPCNAARVSGLACFSGLG